MHTHDCHCHEDYGSSKGPAWFYGYCHDTGQMRMMDYPDYMKNMQTSMSNLYSGATSTAQTMAQQMAATMPAANPMMGQKGRSRRDHHDCGCRQEHDCGCECECECRIRCADAVEYARCGEVRQIPITFENDTRRERSVTLSLGAFTTESGQQLGWQTSLSESSFTLPACGRKTVLLTVPVQCGTPSTNNPNPTGGQQPGNEGSPATGVAVGVDRTNLNQVDSCRVAYASLQAEGCRVRPMVIAVAVLPNHCGSHHAECGCGCC